MRTAPRVLIADLGVLGAVLALVTRAGVVVITVSAVAVAFVAVALVTVTRVAVPSPLSPSPLSPSPVFMLEPSPSSSPQARKPIRMSVEAEPTTNCLRFM